jgi:hypothetical protein
MEETTDNDFSTIRFATETFVTNSLTDAPPERVSARTGKFS